jgi:phosphoglycolate phosphatase
VTCVRAGERSFDVDLIIFDKDGTLFDFQAMWTRLCRKQAEALRVAAGQDASFVVEVYTALGVEPDGPGLDPRGPLALATGAEIEAIMAWLLYRRGVPWDEAARLARQVSAREHWPPLTDLVQPVGDVAGLLWRLRSAGVRIGVLTTDVRAMTETMLSLIGAAGLVDALVCADDGLPFKPAPDGILALCEQVGAPPARAMIVGDAPTDLLAGRAAGVAACVGVMSGVGRRHDLEPLADVVLDTIEQIELC